jgi:hypothetical protein
MPETYLAVSPVSAINIRGIEQTDAAVIGAVDGGTVVVAIKPPESQQ